MHHGADTPKNTYSRICRENSAALRDLEFYDSLGRRDPQRAWQEFTRARDWTAAVSGTPQNVVDARAEVVRATATPISGGHLVNGTWCVSPGAVGEWTVVRAPVRPADGAGPAPVPFLHVVRTNQWRWLSPEGASPAAGARVALVDAVIPEGLLLRARSDRHEEPRCSPEPVLVGSVGVSLGVAAAALDRLGGGGPAPRGGRPATATEQEPPAQELVDLRLALMAATHELREAITRHAVTHHGADALGEALLRAARTAQQVVTFAYEVSLSSHDGPAREEMARLVAGAAPALQNSRFAHEFLRAALRHRTPGAVPDAREAE